MPAGPRPLTIVVSLPPEAYFVERVGGPRVQVAALVAPGQSPHTFEPLPTQVATLAAAAVYFTIGLPFEAPLVAKVRGSHPDLRVVDLRQGVKLLPATDAHEGGEADPHCWLDPLRVVPMVETIRGELARLDPAGQAVYDANAAAFVRDLRSVDREIRQTLAGLNNRRFMVLHPAFGYFAAAYGLTQVAIEHEGKEPDARRLGALITEAKRQGSRVIFAQPGYSPLPADAIAREIGGHVVKLDPMAHDYLDNLRAIAGALRAGEASP